MPRTVSRMLWSMPKEGRKPNGKRHREGLYLGTCSRCCAEPIYWGKVKVIENEVKPNLLVCPGCFDRYLLSC